MAPTDPNALARDSQEAVADSSEFSAWPGVTQEPIPIPPMLWDLCVSPPPEVVEAEEAEAARHGPHASYSIIVRVSPEADQEFRSGDALPVGSVVVKEKYDSRIASGPLYAYATMTKREAGYYPEGGDWEYAYVTLVPKPDRSATRGRLAGCSQCHSSARDGDYLFRTYLDVESGG